MWPSTGAGVGPNASTPHTIKYTFPTGYVGGSCYINYMQHSNGGYIDVYAMRTQDTDEIFVNRINTYQHVSNAAGASHNGGIRVDCIMSGLDSFDQVEIRCKKGILYLMSVCFTKEVDRPTTPMALVHSDNVVGDPSSLSDSRIKQNQQPASQTALCRVFDALVPKTYDRQDNPEMTPEHRIGFIADDVKAAMAMHMPNVTNVISERPVGEEQLLALDYSRLTTVLWSKVKDLEARIQALEAQ